MQQTLPITAQSDELEQTLQLSDIQLVPPPREFLVYITVCLILAIGPMVLKYDVIQKNRST